ncbi:hypothetical protein [Scytonema sp. PCC 10023]|uniref:hypothetical protein n=1 Tax=Scytonema sp. PCC 10023 TaxID=1680591 RepID=UPI0039C5B4BF
MMSRLKVVDLSFFETELPSDSQVHGGLTVYSPTGSSYSTSATSNSSSGSNVTHYFDRATGKYSYNIGYYVAGAVAGGVAGAAADGSTFTTAYSSASA